MEQKLHLVRNTVVTALIYFFVCFIAGAIMIVGGLEGTTAVLTQTVCLVISSFLAILFYTVRKRNLSEIGLISFQRGALKDIYFAVPLVAISISALFVGVNTDAFKASFANLLLAVAVGFSEEIYFRGIIYHIWEKRNKEIDYEKQIICFRKWI